MVTCKYVGQTGNQFFIAAAAMAVAIRNGDEFLSPHESTAKTVWKFELHHLPKYTGTPQISTYYKEKSFGFSGRIPYTKDMCLTDGYFQSYLHFWDVKDDVIAGLNPPRWSDEPLNKTAIHVRRCDYVKWEHKHPPVDAKYIGQAMSRFPSDEPYLFFSDDIPWCRANFGHMDNVEFSEGKSGMQDMELISRCRNVIIANSTFSYWGAMFNKQGGIVISPSQKNWFGPGNRHLNTEYLLPPDWVQIRY